MSRWVKWYKRLINGLRAAASGAFVCWRPSLLFTCQKCIVKRARLLSSYPWLFFLLSLIPYTDEIHFLTPKISGSGNISDCQQQSYSGLHFPGGASTIFFFYGGPRSNPFPLKYYFWQKKYLFQIPSTNKWYHFHIPSEKHCTPFNSCVNVPSLKYEKMLYQYVL